MTIEIHGRTPYADEATNTITITEDRFSDPIMVIHGGEITERNHDGVFVIESRHMSGVDIEHDAAKVAYLEGGGLKYVSMLPNGVNFTGAIFKAEYYVGEAPVFDEVCKRCEEEHPYMEYMPPKQKWEPGNYLIEVRWNK